MKLIIEYKKLDGAISEFLKCKLVGTYTKENITVGFKVYDEIRNGYRNLRFTGIKRIQSA